jgi:hypothetical protein
LSKSLRLGPRPFSIINFPQVLFGRLAGFDSIRPDGGGMGGAGGGAALGAGGVGGAGDGASVPVGAQELRVGYLPTFLILVRCSRSLVLVHVMRADNVLGFR